jgi:hypothetical protein
MSFLAFDRIAAARGDGLRPELRILLERRAAVESAPHVVAINTGDTGRPAVAQPAGATAFLPGNVVPLAPKHAAAAAPARNLRST